MLAEPGDTVVLLPSRTRYEQPGGGTETSTERRILFSPEVPGRRIGESRSDWEILVDVAARVRPADAARIRFPDGQAIRAEIGRLIPAYRGIETLSERGDQVQYGGRRLCEGGVFPRPDGKAHFVIPALVDEPLPPGAFRLATRRGKQFNSMVQEERDPLNGARRDAVLMSKQDAAALGVGQGDRIVVRSRVGEFRGHAHLAPIKPGNVQAHFPEANDLLELDARETSSGIPDYGVIVTIEREGAWANGIPPSRGAASGSPRSSARPSEASPPSPAAPREEIRPAR
jgi:anaerobic selenocysteine-containing dehydrogenase